MLFYAMVNDRQPNEPNLSNRNHATPTPHKNPINTATLKNIVTSTTFCYVHIRTLYWDTPRSHSGHPRIYFTIKPHYLTIKPHYPKKHSLHQKILFASLYCSEQRKDCDETFPTAARNPIPNSHSATKSARHTATMQKNLQSTHTDSAKHGQRAAVSTAATTMVWYGKA